MLDTYEAFDTFGFARELRTNHRSEGKLIFDNANLIRRKRMPVLDGARGFRLLTPACLPRDSKASHRLNAKGEKDMGQGKMETYRALLWSEENRNMCGLEDPANSQIIEFTK